MRLNRIVRKKTTNIKYDFQNMEYLFIRTHFYAFTFARCMCCWKKCLPRLISCLKAFEMAYIAQINATEITGTPGNHGTHH